MFLLRFILGLIFAGMSLVAGYYGITYAMSAIGIADNVFASSLASEFTLYACVWGIIAVLCAACARKAF